MANDLLKSFAEELKTIREQQRYTLQSLHNKTRIEMKYLQAIEDAKFDIIGDVYMRSFIKGYVKALDLDEVFYIKKYDMAKNGRDINEPIEEEEVVEEVETELDDEIKESDPPAKPHTPRKQIKYNEDTEVNTAQMKRSFNIVIYIFLTIVVALIIAIVLIVRSSKPEIVVEKSYEEVAKEQEERFQMNEELRDSSFAYTNGKLNVKLKAHEMSWFNSKLDAGEPSEFLLRRNKDTLIVADKVMELRIGNSEGIEIFINNIKTEIPGGKSRVKYIRIDPSGISEIKNKSGYRNDTSRN